MRCSFVPSSALNLPPVLPPGTDATAHHAAFPRPMRKTLRLAKSNAPRNPEPLTTASGLPDAVDSFMRTEYRYAAEYLQNLEYAGELADEFGDVDDEHEGLTIVEAMDEEALWRFCTGYDVL